MTKYLSTGVSLYNLQLTGDVSKGIKEGSYAFIVGDSSAGKSFLAATIAAEAAIDEQFNDYNVYYDDVENGCGFDIESLFSNRVAKRIQEPPRGTSVFVDDFYLNVQQAMKEGPCVYVLDSQDGLTTRDESKKLDEIAAAVKKAGGDTEKALKSLSGQMSDGKAKKHSQLLRKTVSMLEETKSILIILGQTRDDLEGYAVDNLVWAGGRALKFYSHLMLFLSVKARLKKTVNGTPREIGIASRVKVVKNRQTGKRSEMTCPIYYTVGYDDLGSVIDWLVEEDVFTLSGQSLTDLRGLVSDKKITKQKLIEKIEADEKLQTKLMEMAQNEWNSIEKKCSVVRKNKYK